MRKSYDNMRQVQKEERDNKYLHIFQLGIYKMAILAKFRNFCFYAEKSFC